MPRFQCPLDQKIFETRRGYDTHKATHRPKRAGGYEKDEWPDAEPLEVE